MSLSILRELMKKTANGKGQHQLTKVRIWRKGIGKKTTGKNKDYWGVL
jgi:hypothetical protein